MLATYRHTNTTDDANCSSCSAPRTSTEPSRARAAQPGPALQLRSARLQPPFRVLALAARRRTTQSVWCCQALTVQQSGCFSCSTLRWFRCWNGPQSPACVAADWLVSRAASQASTSVVGHTPLATPGEPSWLAPAAGAATLEPAAHTALCLRSQLLRTARPAVHLAFNCCGQAPEGPPHMPGSTPCWHAQPVLGHRQNMQRARRQPDEPHCPQCLLYM